MRTFSHSHIYETRILPDNLFYIFGSLYSGGFNIINKGYNLDLIPQFKSIINSLPSIGPTNMRRIDEEIVDHICMHFQPLHAVILPEVKKEQELIIAFISAFIVSVQSIATSAHSSLLMISGL